VPSPAGYAREESFYRHSLGPAGSRRRALTRRIQHVPDLLAYRRRPDLPDVVHLQWEVMLDLALSAPRPTVVTVHDPHGVSRGLDRADAVVVHTEYARAALAHRVSPDRLHVIHHGPLEATVAPGALPPELGPDTGAPVVLLFGIIRAYKGIATLLEAWRTVKDAQLWIVGRPLEAVSIPADVGYVPRYVTPAEQAALFSRADIVAVPYLQSERFGFSGVLATALAAGKPTVVSALGGFAEVIASGAVRAVPPGDPAALATALQELIDQPEARMRWGAAASRAAAEEFSWTRAAERTLALYRQVIA
jgi:glycosyltransferase involved in cell wall biosynthesis